jgi:hypothetical protein
MEGFSDLSSQLAVGADSVVLAVCTSFWKIFDFQWLLEGRILVEMY